MKNLFSGLVSMTFLAGFALLSNSAWAGSAYYGAGSGGFTVPAGVTSITISGGGGGGGGGCWCAGGNSGCGTGGQATAVSGTYTVTPGEVLSVSMGFGGNGGCAMGAAGGGGGGYASVTGPGVDFENAGGNGGGASWYGTACYICGGAGGNAAVTIYW